MCKSTGSGHTVTIAAMSFLSKKNFSISIGNIIEWYDFVLYGYFAYYIGVTFFPIHNHYLSLIAAFLTFGLGYLVRPIGAVLFGYIGDCFGHKKALYWSIALIMLPTFLIGVLPGYHTMGFLSPILLLILRLLQGISAGGQYPGTVLVLHQDSGDFSRARNASLAYAVSIVGILIASFVGYLCMKFSTASYAWRLPFIFSILFMFIFYMLGGSLKKESEGKAAKTKSSFPILSMLKTNKFIMLKFTVLMIISNFFYSFVFIFMVTYMHVYLKMKMSEALLINFISMLLMCISIYKFAGLADRYGRKKILLAGGMLGILFVVPSFELINGAHFFLVLLGCCLLTLSQAAIASSIFVLCLESLPKKLRYTSFSLVYNIATSLSGFSPALFAYFLHVRKTSDLLLGFIFLSFLLITLLVMFFTKDSYVLPDSKNALR